MTRSDSRDRFGRSDTRDRFGRSDTRDRFGRRTRRVVLVVHVISAAAWLGIDVVVGLLVGAGRLAGDPQVRAVAYRALALVVVPAMAAAAIACLGTGLVAALGSRWGLVRYWWVMIKFVITVVLCVLIMVVLLPGMPAVDGHGVDLAAGRIPTEDVSSLVFPPVVSLTALSVATTLSVVKPWGRLRRSPRRRVPAAG